MNPPYRQHKKAPDCVRREKGTRKRVCPRFAPDKQACRSTIGECEPYSVRCTEKASNPPSRQYKKAPDWVPFAIGGEKGIRTLDTG